MMLTRSLQLGIRFMTGRGNSGLTRHIMGAVFGIAVSLIPLVVVLEVTTGMIGGITDRYLEIGTYHIQVRNYTQNGFTEASGIIKKLNSMPGIRTAFPVIHGVGLAYSPTGRTGITLKALSKDYWDQDRGIHQYLKIISGSFDLSTEDSALVSSETAKKLHISVGDKITILTARTIPGGRTILKPSHFTVKGLFSTGYYELDSLSVYINLLKGKKLFNDPESFFIGVKIVNPEKDVNKMAHRIQRMLQHNWFVFTWFDLQKPMYESFKTTKILLLFIMMIIVLVAAVNISSALVMMVMEKEADVAILKSTGVSGSSIISAYIFSGFIIGIIGTVIGIITGLVAAVNINGVIHGIQYFLNFSESIIQIIFSPFTEIAFHKIVLVNSTYYLDRIPIIIDFKNIFIISTGSVLLSTLASIIPAFQAGKIKPMEVIRRQ